ncbi:GntR family transcriptional regulator [Pseudomonas typographi]|uniref:GntR family transcriptional regulator n=1 Tax=Pseudomonas typographi TaxID=2715964 RepID=UPI001687E666|nr:GntR family transcriptional regulator [Pseudomonas typographi]MBD1552822.1 GntR family transcriptional regulator [Pseudomonas typographi]
MQQPIINIDIDSQHLICVRIEVSMSVLPSSKTGAKRITRKVDHIFHLLREEIVLGKRLAGDALLETALALEFSTSQGTVREALMRLAEEGLVFRDGYRGTQIAGIGLSEAEELLAIRLRLERLGFRCARARYDDKLLTTLGGLIHEMHENSAQGHFYASMECDHAFHLSLFRCARLPVLEPVLGRCMLHMHRLSFAYSRAIYSEMERRSKRAENAFTHQRLIDALSIPDEAAAEEEIEAHILAVWQRGLSAMRAIRVNNQA